MSTLKIILGLSIPLAAVVLGAGVVALIALRASEGPSRDEPPGCDPMLTPLLQGLNFDPVDLEPQLPTALLEPPPPNVPDPPEGMGSAELVERGHIDYRSGRLHDARVAYQQALQLDPACEICGRRIDRINAELAQQIEQQLATGQRYFGELRTQEAVAAWERVLLLAPDPGHPAHVQALGYLEQAGGR